MARKVWALLAALLLCLPLGGGGESAAPAGITRRALLVACDFFLSQEDTWPASGNNLKAVADALTGGLTSFALVDKRSGTLHSVAGLEQAVMDTLGAADDDDVSYFYISTHGVYDPTQSNLEAGLLLSDGVVEETLTARQLNQILDQVKGTKVIIIDACNSGAFIGKGLSGGAREAGFQGPQYKVLTSSGGSEESWYWSNTGKGPVSVQGGGYFSSVLADGLGLYGEYAADINRDGNVTLKECYDYLMENHAASTPQCYPQEDDFVLFSYDPHKALAAPDGEGALTGITFFDTVLSALEPSVTFEFTASRPVQMAYQLVYYRDGKWSFPTAQLIYDDQEQGGDYGDMRGAISPGRKERTLNLSLSGEDTYGYAMIQLVTIQAGRAIVHGSRVLCVPPVSGDPELAVRTGTGFTPSRGQELAILANHKYPCLLSVSIVDKSGSIVKRLASGTPTRPQQLTPAGSYFYWNGMRSDGSPAAPGTYTVSVTARIGDTDYQASSESFALTAE